MYLIFLFLFHNESFCVCMYREGRNACIHRQGGANISIFCVYVIHECTLTKKRLTNKLAKPIKTRSSHHRYSIEKMFLKTSHTKKPVLKSLFNTVAGPTQVFPYEFCKNFKNTSRQLLLKNFTFNALILLTNWLFVTSNNHS